MFPLIMQAWLWQLCVVVIVVVAVGGVGVRHRCCCFLAFLLML